VSRPILVGRAPGDLLWLSEIGDVLASPYRDVAIRQR